MAKKYVMHFCKNNKCNNGWIDVDLTNCTSRPPKWKYCKDCCKQHGYINNPANAKKPRSEKQLLHQEKFLNAQRNKVIKPC